MEALYISSELIGETLLEDIESADGLLLLKSGIILNEGHIALLQKYKINKKINVQSNEQGREIEHSPQVVPYRNMIETTRDVFQQMTESENCDVSQLTNQYHEFVREALDNSSIYQIISKTVDEKDYLYQHSINVGILSAIIGKLLGYTSKDIMTLADMGLFHDIGMLRVPEAIRFKKGKLTHGEYEVIKSHTKQGYTILNSYSLHTLIKEAALLHHIRLDNSGYPNSNSKEIPFLIQIISIADCFNAMSMKTYGTPKKDFSSVYELMEESFNNRLNPAIVVPFVRYIMRQLLHKQVQLSNGENAEIVFIHDNEPHQPLVKVTNEEYYDLRKHHSMRIQSLA